MFSDPLFRTVDSRAVVRSVFPTTDRVRQGSRVPPAMLTGDYSPSLFLGTDYLDAFSLPGIRMRAHPRWHCHVAANEGWPIAVPSCSTNVETQKILRKCFAQEESVSYIRVVELVVFDLYRQLSGERKRPIGLFPTQRHRSRTRFRATPTLVITTISA